MNKNKILFIAVATVLLPCIYFLPLDMKKVFLPTYLYHGESWKAIWPVPCAALFIAYFILIFDSSDDEEKKTYFSALLSFSILGLVTGIITGHSREPTVGMVLPSVLSIFGGFAIYIIGKDASIRKLVSMCVFVLAFSLFLGIRWGAILRTEFEKQLLSSNYLIWVAQQENIVEEFKKIEKLKLDAHVAEEELRIEGHKKLERAKMDLYVKKYLEDNANLE